MQTEIFLSWTEESPSYINKLQFVFQQVNEITPGIMNEPFVLVLDSTYEQVSAEK